MFRVALIALMITLGQVGLAMLIAPAGSPGTRYQALKQWDSDHYLDIAARGYVLPGGELTSDDVHSRNTNLAFFPGYPIVVRAISEMTGVSAIVSALVCAQVFAWLFWFAFILLLETFGLARRAASFAALIVAIHPAAFFLVAAYTESMFLSGLTGLILLSRRRFEACGAAAGILMSGARFFGIVGALYFPIKAAVDFAFGRRLDFRKVTSALGCAGVASAGAWMFFLWCEFEFGRWDLYFHLQKIGWRNEPDYFALFKPGTYIPRFFYEHTVDSISRSSVPFSVFLFGLALSWERKVKDGIEERLPLLIVAFLLFFVAVSGKANAKMDSMIRYSLPVFALMVASLAAVWQKGLELDVNLLPQARIQRLIWRSGFLLALSTQIWMMRLFLRGSWVA